MKQEYGITTSVIAILNNLEWSLISKHRQYSTLTLFFKFYSPVIRIPQHYLLSTLNHIRTTCSTLTIYITSHYSHLWHISERVSPQGNHWLNNLPDKIIESDTLDYYTLSLKSYAGPEEALHNWSGQTWPQALFN